MFRSSRHTSSSSTPARVLILAGTGAPDTTVGMAAAMSGCPGNGSDRPDPHAVWVDGHWVHERGGWYWVEGHWRY